MKIIAFKRHLVNKKHIKHHQKNQAQKYQKQQQQQQQCTKKEFELEYHNHS